MPKKAMLQSKPWAGKKQKILLRRRGRGRHGYYFDFQQGERVYHIHDRQIFDHRGHKVSTMKVCSDVTENHAPLRRLESDAGLDAMTGLMNRRKIE